MQKLIIANWKMQLGVAASVKLARTLAPAARRSAAAVVLCPSFPALAGVAAMVSKSTMLLGAQNLSTDDRGALSGEVSGADLYELGCHYVIVGHSERRALGETDAVIRKKLIMAQKEKLIPILCVGESAAARKKGSAEVLVRKQLQAANGLRKFFVAYEPLWAIGSSNPATPRNAKSMHAFIRRTLGTRAAGVLYGGSVTPENAAAFLETPGIDGLLVGGASTKPTFARILAAGGSH